MKKSWPAEPGQHDCLSSVVSPPDALLANVGEAQENSQSGQLQSESWDQTLKVLEELGNMKVKG